MKNFVTVNSLSEFRNVVENYQFVLIEFWAPWCGASKITSALLANLATEFSSYTGLSFVRIDIDEQTEIASQYMTDLKMHTVPSYVLFENGEVAECIKSADVQRLWNIVRTSATRTEQVEETEKK